MFPGEDITIKSKFIKITSILFALILLSWKRLLIKVLEGGP